MSSQNVSNFSAAVTLRPRASAAHLRQPPVPPPFELLQHLAPDRPARPARRDRDVGAAQPAAGRAPRSRGGGRRARCAMPVRFSTDDAHRRPARHVRLAEQQLHRQQRRVDRGEHRDLVGRGARRRATWSPARSPRVRCAPGAVRATVSASASLVGLGRDDLLVDAAPVVREQVARRADDRRRAAVVGVRARGACRRGSSGRS